MRCSGSVVAQLSALCLASAMEIAKGATSARGKAPGSVPPTVRTVGSRSDLPRAQRLVGWSVQVWVEMTGWALAQG